MTTDRSSQRQSARLGAIVVAIGAFVAALTFETASATATTLEPQVEIGESRSIERATPTVNSAEPGHADDGVGVAVAGVAIARAAPPASNRLEADLANGGTKALLFLAAALCAASATAAALRYFSRRIVP